MQEGECDLVFGLRMGGWNSRLIRCGCLDFSIVGFVKLLEVRAVKIREPTCEGSFHLNLKGFYDRDFRFEAFRF